MKTHFLIGTGQRTACGRTGRTSTTPGRVSCLSCRNRADWQVAKQQADAAAEEAFQAQEPHTIVPQFGRVNDDGVMECYECKGVLFRERPRSLWSYHYVCSACGTSMHPMTETGMCT